MKKTILLSAASALMLSICVNAQAGCIGTGWSMWDSALHTPACCPPNCPYGNTCVDKNYFVTAWVDPALAIATGLEALATYAQREKTVKADKALAQLEQYLGGGCSGSGADQQETSDTSLSGTDSVPVAPEVVLQPVDGPGSFDAIRQATEEYLFVPENCTEDSSDDRCDENAIMERQSTWLLTSISLASATGDKLLAASKDMISQYQDLVADFNGQNGPQGMWGSSSKITLHTHVQQNDINALYARDLEMNALLGIRESKKAKFIKR